MSKITDFYASISGDKNASNYSTIYQLDKEIANLRIKIAEKESEMNSILNGSNLSEIEKAAREEYIRTGSSSAMQAAENQKINQAMTAQNQTAVNEEKENDLSVDAVSKMRVISQLYSRFLDNGNALSNEDRSILLSAYDDLQKIAGKINKKAVNDKDNNGIDDSIDDKVIEVEGGKTALPSTITPENRTALSDAIKATKSQADQNALVKNYLTKLNATNPELFNKDGSIDLDVVKDEELLTWAKTAGIKSYSGSSAREKQEKKNDEAFFAAASAIASKYKDIYDIYPDKYLSKSKPALLQWFSQQQKSGKFKNVNSDIFTDKFIFSLIGE